MGKSYNLLDLGSFIFIYFIQVSLVDNVLISTVEQNDFFFIFLEIIYFELKFKKKIYFQLSLKKISMKALLRIFVRKSPIGK